MLRALWYLIKIICIIGVTVFLAAQSGSVIVDWQDYHITIQLGFVAAALFMSFWVVFIASGFAARLALWPREKLRAHRERQRVRGYRALLQSMTAAATGDKKTAYYMAFRAQKLLPDDEAGLPLLLQAQSQPDSNKARDDVYAQLLQNADTALLGLQGMTQNAILAGDFEKALLLAREAVKSHPKNKTPLKGLYDLELKNRQWNDALVTLKRLQKERLTEKEAARSDRVALYLILGDMARDAERGNEALKFYKMAQSESSTLFVPTILRLAKSYQTTGNAKKAVSLIEKSWQRAPHPDLIAAWAELWGDIGAAKKVGYFMWVKKLADAHSTTTVAQLAIARAAITDGLWGEARAALALAEKSGQSSDIYDVWALLEEQSGGKPEAIRQWMDRSRMAAHQDKGSGAWVCEKTGRCYKEWAGMIEPERLFNTLYWDEAAQPQILKTLSAASV